MAIALEDVTQLALLLPADEKATLIDRLLQTFDTEVLDDWEEAWIEEVEKRYRELKEGKVAGIPADEAFASIRAELKCRQ
ncbi:addiction module protein [candidate division KSB1 bacterium]|nr:addiction module protein [candidate division KSB1 bacterium]